MNVIVSICLALALTPTPLTLTVYPMCSDDRGSLWEIEANHKGLVDASTTPTFTKRTTRVVRVTEGDTFFRTRSSVVYIREHGGSAALTATASGDRC